MENFEQRRNEYFNKLRDNIEVIEHISKAASENDNNKKTFEMILMPRTEKELQVSNLIIDFTLDLISLTQNALYDNVNNIDIPNCLVVTIYSKLIQILKNKNSNIQEELKNIFIGFDDAEKWAKFYYEIIVAFASNPDEIFEVLASKSGFDINDELELLQFQSYLSKASDFANSAKKYDFDINNSEHVEFLNKFTKEFHRICKSTIKEDSNKLKK